VAEVCKVPCAEVVDADDGVAFREQSVTEMRAQEAGAPVTRTL
jgi:hypothetical protein